MGKKSKKNAAGGAKQAKAATSAASRRDETGATAGETGGGILTSSTGGGKKQRCVLCCALLKDLAKAHQCPGCSVLYCWRCERKFHKQVPSCHKCPNGDNCVRPILRCKNCSLGTTMQRELVAAGALAPNEKMFFTEHWSPALRKEYQAIVQSRADLTIDSWPLLVCGTNDCTSHKDKSFEEMLASMECIHCALGPSSRKLLSCSRCEKIRCNACTDVIATQHNAVCDQLRALVGSVLFSNTSVTTKCWSTFINAGGCDAMSICTFCQRSICGSCMEVTEQGQMIRTMWELDNGLDPHYSKFKCSTCYWASKPCTNPDCPNEVGIPTKRCGGCHIDRYCSVECQAAMHPEHVERCQKIQEKRSTAGKNQREEE